MELQIRNLMNFANLNFGFEDGENLKSKAPAVSLNYYPDTPASVCFSRSSRLGFRPTRKHARTLLFKK
jgi:hypothetical protein